MNDLFYSLMKELYIFQDLSSNAIKELGKRFVEKIYNKDEIIFKEGDVSNSLMIIASGEVRITQKVSESNEEALMVLKKGDVFGEMALLENLPRTAYAIAHTNVVIFEITRTDFYDFIDKDCENGVKILLKIAMRLSSRLREADIKLKTFLNLTQWL